MATSTKTEPSEAGKAFLSGGLNEYLAYMRSQEAAKPVVEESKAAPAASAPAAAAQSWTQQQLADAGNFIAKNIDNPGAIEAARASVEKATGINISPADILKAAQSVEKPPELSRAMADVLSGDVYGNMTARQAYDWITKGIIDQPQMSAQTAQGIMRNLGISNRDVAQAALLDPRISAGAQYALTSTPLYQSGQQSGLAALNENLRDFINKSLQAQSPTQAEASLRSILQSGLLTGGKALNEYDVERATGKTLSQLFGPQGLPPTRPLPPITEPYVTLTAPAPEAAPPALSPGASGLDPSNAVVGKIPVSEQVKLPQLDTEFRASAPRAPVYDRLGRVTGYEYTPAAKLTSATGTTVFNWTPPGVTSRPRQLLNVRDIPGATMDPVTGETRMPLSASQQFARDRAQLDREFRRMYAQRAATDSSIPAQAPAAASQAFREAAMSDPAFSAQLRLRELEQQRFEPTRADMALRAQYGAAPYQAALSSMFTPFITRNLPTLQSLVQTKVPTYSEKYPDIAAEYAKMPADLKKQFPTLEDYEQYHYQTYGKSEGRDSPTLGRGTLTSPYTSRFLKDGGEVSTEDFIAKKANGGDVSRETLPPKLPPGVQRAVDKAQGSRTVLPVPGVGETRQFLSGFVGASPDYSVMDPNYKALGKSYRAGEQAAVASEVFGAMTPFATASALAKTRQIPGVSQLIAYHGTPKSDVFRAFDPKYIKTGEGNTQYGYGFYFAENPKVSGTYKRMESEYKRMTGGLDPKTERAYDFMAQGLSEPEILSRLNYYYGSELSFDDAMKAVNQAKQHFNVGRLYKVDIDDAKIAKMLDWDAPLSEQSTVIQNLAKQYKLNPDDLGGDLVHAMKAKTPEGAKLMSEAGVPGIKYLDQGSRGLPQIKKQFLDELDQDASAEEVMDLLGKKVFSAKNEALLRELNNNDWLGFDYPSQAISEVFRAGFFRTNPDITEGLKKAVSAARQPDKGTRNIVVFPGEESSIKMLEVDGAPIEKKRGGEVSTRDFIAKFADGSPNPDEVPSVIDERDEIRSESQRMLNRLKAQGPRSTGFVKGRVPEGVAALQRDIEQRQIDAAKPGSAAQLPLIDRPAMRIASDIVRGAVSATPAEPTNPSEAYRLMQGLTGAYLPTAPVVRMGQSAKAAVQQPGATVASAKRGVEELGDTAAAQLARISRPNELGSQAGVIKPKGGNWFKNLDSVEFQLNALLKNAGARNLPADQVLAEMNATYTPEAMARLSPESLAQVERAYAELKPAAAINKWINTKLTKYVKNEMGTPEDPVRALAERGVLHIPTYDLDIMGLTSKRERAGMPMAPQGQSEAARFWEQMSDKVIDFTTPSRIKKQAKQGAWEHQRNENIELLRENPWIKDVSADTKIYRPSISEDLVDSAGFDHLVDELTNAMSPQSNLPDALRVQPKDLEKMTVPQAVERVAKINDWRINNKKALAIEETNKADLYKDYPEQKYRWIQLNKPGQFAAESDAMGHSVRGYEPPEKGGNPFYGLGGWGAIQSGEAKVYSLRDAKGQSHATIEVKHDISTPLDNKAIVAEMERFQPGSSKLQGPEGRIAYDEAMNRVIESRPAMITQIKGEGNKAIKKEFLPFVQDFVRSGNWAEVKDLLNANLLVIDRGSDLAAAMKAENATIPQYITQEELTELLRKYKAYGYKHGGPVDKTTAFIKAHA